MAMVSRSVGGILSSAEAPGWPSICAAYLGTSDGQPVPRLALLRVGFTYERLSKAEAAQAWHDHLAGGGV